MPFRDLALRLWRVAASSEDAAAPFDQLAEEMMELHLSMRGKHSDSQTMELIEIATLAVNALKQWPSAEIAEAFAEWEKRHGQR